MKSMRRLVTMILVAVMALGSRALAANDVTLVQVQTWENDDIAFYVRGLDGDLQEGFAAIGNLECENLSVGRLKDVGASICTFIMIDNSNSIPEKSRNGIKNLLTELVAARAENEKFAISLFGEELELVMGYTNDYLQLKDCIANVQFTDKETYLTDMVYEAISSKAIFGNEGDYVRILLISDGMDGNSVGYTEEELSKLLESSHVPVYSLGVYNGKKTNGAYLEKMFALSRLTGGVGSVYDELETPNAYAETLTKDRDLSVFLITPKEESLDGSEKTVSLVLSAGGEKITLVADRIRMGLKISGAQEPDTSNAPDETSDAKEPGEESAAPRPDGAEADVVKEKEQADDSEKSGGTLLLAIGAIVILIIMAVVALSVRKSKKNKKDGEFKAVSNVDRFNELIGAPAEDTGATQMITNGQSTGEDDSATQSIWDEPVSSKIIVTLKDVAVPARQYQVAMDGLITIGKSTDCNIVIEGDKAISRKHCSIARINGQYYVRDEGSSNGTFLNQARISAEAQIKKGDLIRIGRTELEFSVNA